MMKMSGRVTGCCVVLFLALTCVSAVQRLNSISDLKKINFGQSVSKHSLILLHWFANAVDISYTDVIRLTFDPNSDYGSHNYGNYDTLLDRLPWGYRYYTVGNLNQDTSNQLPGYVVNPPGEYVGGNMARIIIRVREQTIDQVFITQHYDPENTYQITTNLLRQIREFSEGGNQQQLLNLRNRYGSNADHFQLMSLRNTWGSLACLGLLLFIVIQERYTFYQQHSRPETRKMDWGHSAATRSSLQASYNTSQPQMNCGGLLCCLFCFVLICIILFALIANAQLRLR